MKRINELNLIKVTGGVDEIKRRYAICACGQEYPIKKSKFSSSPPKYSPIEQHIYKCPCCLKSVTSVSKYDGELCTNSNQT